MEAKNDSHELTLAVYFTALKLQHAKGPRDYSDFASLVEKLKTTAWEEGKEFGISVSSHSAGEEA